MTLEEAKKRIAELEERVLAGQRNCRWAYERMMTPRHRDRSCSCDPMCSPAEHLDDSCCNLASLYYYAQGAPDWCGKDEDNEQDK